MAKTKTCKGWLALAGVALLGLAGGVGCGGSSGGDALSEGDMVELCKESCEHDNTCDNETKDCTAECAFPEGAEYAEDTRDFVACMTASCEADEDACLLEVPVRGALDDLSATCSEWVTRCSAQVPATFCSVDSTEGLAFMRLYSDALLGKIEACLAKPCAEVEACLDGLGIFGESDG